MNDLLLNFMEIIDEEIVAYENLSELYAQKEEILVKTKSDELFDVDAKIMEQAKEITQLNVKRRESAKLLGNEDFNMSEIIEKAKTVNDELVNKFKSQKKKLNILSDNLKKQENTNLLLIKHGLNINQKMKEIILNVISPCSKQYDKDGKNADFDQRLISFVEEEA